MNRTGENKLAALLSEEVMADLWQRLFTEEFSMETE